MTIETSPSPAERSPQRGRGIFASKSEDCDGIEDFFGVEVVAVVGVDVHGVAVDLFAVRGFDSQILGRRVKVNAFDLPARTVFEHDAVAFTGVVVGDGARALPVPGVAAVQQVGEGVRACAAFE